MQIEIIVREKIARLANKQDFAVCGNSDYIIKFDFDSEWDAYEAKTARFKYNGTYTDVPFMGNECSMPIITNAFRVEIGVYAADLHTTSCAVLPLRKSILCGSETESEVSQEIKDNLDKLLKEKIDNPQTATVGEVLTVEEVDENGKPTKWKTAPAAAEQKQADWGQNDETAASFVKNRICYDNRVETVREAGNSFTLNESVSGFLKIAETDAIDINKVVLIKGKDEYILEDGTVNYSDAIDIPKTYNDKDCIVVNDISEEFGLDASSVYFIDGYDPYLDWNYSFILIKNEAALSNEELQKAGVTSTGLYWDGRDCIVEDGCTANLSFTFIEEPVTTGELKTIDPKYILSVEPKNIKDMYYTAVEEIDLAGYTLTNVNYKGDHDVYPFELGQVWNAVGNNINYTNLEVKKADDGTLYIGDLNKSSTPFFISTTSGGALSAWLSNGNPGAMTLVGVSGKITTEVVHKISDKYIPDGVAYKDELPQMAIMELTVSNTTMIVHINIDDTYNSAFVIVKTSDMGAPSLNSVSIHYKNDIYSRYIINAITKSQVASADIPYVMLLYIDMSMYCTAWLLNPTTAKTAEEVVISSKTYNSTKKFKITVDDNGTLSATEVTK